MTFFGSGTIGGIGGVPSDFTLTYTDVIMAMYLDRDGTNSGAGRTPQCVGAGPADPNNFNAATDCVDNAGDDLLLAIMSGTGNAPDPDGPTNQSNLNFVTQFDEALPGAFVIGGLDVTSGGSNSGTTTDNGGANLVSANSARFMLTVTDVEMSLPVGSDVDCTGGSDDGMCMVMAAATGSRSNLLAASEPGTLGILGLGLLGLGLATRRRRRAN